MTIRHIVMSCPTTPSGIHCGYHGEGYAPGDCVGRSSNAAEPDSVSFIDNGQKYLPAYRVDRADAWSEATLFTTPTGVVLSLVAAQRLAAAVGGDSIVPITLARVGLGDTWEQVCSHHGIDVE